MTCDLAPSWRVSITVVCNSGCTLPLLTPAMMEQQWLLVKIIENISNNVPEVVGSCKGQGNWCKAPFQANFSSRSGFPLPVTRVVISDFCSHYAQCGSDWVEPGLNPAISRVKIFDPGGFFFGYFSVQTSPSTWVRPRTRVELALVWTRPKG